MKNFGVINSISEKWTAIEPHLTIHNINLALFDRMKLVENQKYKEDQKYKQVQDDEYKLNQYELKMLEISEFIKLIEQYTIENFRNNNLPKDMLKCLESINMKKFVTNYIIENWRKYFTNEEDSKAYCELYNTKYFQVYRNKIKTSSTNQHKEIATYITYTYGRSKAQKCCDVFNCINPYYHYIKYKEKKQEQCRQNLIRNLQSCAIN